MQPRRQANSTPVLPAPTEPVRNPSQQALMDFCATLFTDPTRVVLATRIAVLRPLRQPAHTHTDILQFDIANRCGGGWRTAEGLVAARDFTAVVFYPGQSHGHELTPLGPDSECLSYKIRVDADSSVLRHRSFRPMTRTFPQQTMLLKAARRVCRWRALGQADFPVFTGYLCEMLALWPRRGVWESARCSTGWGLDQIPWQGVVDLLEERWRDPPSLPEIARSAHLSTRQITRSFHKAIGCTPKEYMDRLRLAHAQGLLWQQDLSVKAIAQELGFASVHHFTRWFRCHAGLPPGRFRAQEMPL